jgi:hypothetical protein
MGALNEKQMKFLVVLRGFERSGETFTVEALTTMTDWTIATVKTYVGKKLRGRFVFETDQPGRYVARHLVELPDSDFAAVMSQMGSFDQIAQQLDHLSRPEWEEAIEVLVRAGKRRGFDTTPLLERLLEQVR